MYNKQAKLAMNEFERRRKALLHYQLWLKVCNIAKFIAIGGNPSIDPDYKDDYFYLVSELGEDILIEQVNRICLSLKKEKNG